MNITQSRTPANVRLAHHRLVTIAAVTFVSTVLGIAEARATNPLLAPADPEIWAVIDMPSGRDFGPAMVGLELLFPGSEADLSQRIPAAVAARVGAKSLDGVDLSRSIRLVVLDPNLYPEPVVALVGIANAARLRRSVAPKQRTVRGKRALLGAANARKRAGRFLFGPAGRVPSPPEPRAIIYGHALIANQQALEPLGTMATHDDLPTMALLRLVLAGIQAATQDIQYLELRFVGGQAGGQPVVGLDLRIAPRVNSLMARFARAQRESSFSLLDALPALPSAFVLGAGEFHLGPLGAQVDSFLEHLAASLFGPAAWPKIQPRLKEALSRFTGEFATALVLAPSFATRSYNLSAVYDTDRARSALFALQQTVAVLPARVPMFGISPKVRFTIPAFTYRGFEVAAEKGSIGVPIPESLDPLARLFSPSSTTYHSAFANLWASVTGQRVHMKKLIDTALDGGGLTLPARMQRVVALARGRKDSAVMLIELSRLAFFAKFAGVTMPAREFTAAITMGFAGGEPRVFLGVVL